MQENNPTSQAIGATKPDHQVRPTLDRGATKHHQDPTDRGATKHHQIRLTLDRQACQVSQNMPLPLHPQHTAAA